MRPLARIPLVATAALMLFTSTASAQIGSDVLGGGDGPTVLDPGTPPASGVAVFASCTVARRAGTTVWFGYSNPLAERRVALVGPGNTVGVNGVIGANRGQITQLQPGMVERAFAVTVPVGSTATWAVTPQSILGASEAPTSATSGPLTPACGAGVGVRSATPQIVGALVPTIGATPVNQLISNGLLMQSSLRFSTNGVVSACSDGGVPLPPKVLWGYNNGGAFVPVGAPYGALPADRVIRVDSNADTGVMFERSYQATRRIVDPQTFSVYGEDAEGPLGTQQVAWGYSSVSVIADVEARCLFATGIVKSSTTVWVDPTFGSGFTFDTVTDQASQTTRPAEFCFQSTPGCDVRVVGVGPGGRSFR